MKADGGFLFTFSVVDRKARRPGVELWKWAMRAALTAWLSTSRRDADAAEVLNGVCHLVAGGMPVQGEPEQTLSYFVGEPSAATLFFTAMRSNGATGDAILAAAQRCGIDALRYMALAERRERPSGYDETLRALQSAAQAIEAAPSAHLDKDGVDM